MQPILLLSNIITSNFSEQDSSLFKTYAFTLRSKIEYYPIIGLINQTFNKKNKIAKMTKINTGININFIQIAYITGFKGIIVVPLEVPEIVKPSYISINLKSSLQQNIMDKGNFMLLYTELDSLGKILTSINSTDNDKKHEYDLMNDYLFIIHSYN